MPPGFSIPVLCGAGRSALPILRRISGAAPQTLQDGESECLVETVQEDAVHAFKKGSLWNVQVFQRSQPQTLMRKEQGFPAVKGGNGDPCTPADLLYACPAQKIVPQHQEDEP